MLDGVGLGDGAAGVGGAELTVTPDRPRAPCGTAYGVAEADKPDGPGRAVVRAWCMTSIGH